RIGEELIYHSPYNPKYIQELNEVLVEVGIKEKEVLLKKEKGATNTSTNKQKKKSELPDIAGKIYLVNMASGFTHSQSVFDREKEIVPMQKMNRYPLTAIPNIIIRKAMNRIPFYYFDNLKRHFPQLHTANEFITGKNYLGAVSFDTNVELNKLGPDQKLSLAIGVIEQVVAVNFDM
ncbi:MAG TPA: hypothetical protein VM888_08865, partial [Chitinophagaceae bacterium]|nr:hypothetical protein [Chitinophagaceae bacterium]